VSTPHGVVHECPPPGGSFTRCCLRTSSELPLCDLFTRDPDRVTCALPDTALVVVDTDGGESPFGWSELPR